MKRTTTTRLGRAVSASLNDSRESPTIGKEEHSTNNSLRDVILGGQGDYVLLVMNEKGLNGLLGDKFAIGGEVGVAAGPVGRTASAATDAQLQAEILTYSRSKGVIVGVDLNGTAIPPDNKLNEAFYGMKARDVLNGTVGRTPSGGSIFPETLRRY